MKIGVIDSGLDPTVVYVNRLNIKKYAEFTVNHGFNSDTCKYRVYDEDDIARWYLYPNPDNIFSDLNRHGTKIVETINLLAKNQTYYVAKVLDERSIGYDANFIAAFKWLLDLEPDIINLSLGMFNKAYMDDLLQLTREAAEKNIIVACAASAEISYPAAFDTVFTVCDAALKNNWNSIDERMRSAIDVICEPEDFGILITSTSVACAVFTGHLCNSMETSFDKNA